MKHIYFVRHGQSVMNVAGQWSGSSDTPLTELGHEQAKLAGKAAKEQGLQFDLIMSSPLQRAHNTAQHIATATGYLHEHIVLHDDLQERHFGVLEGVRDMEAFDKRNQGEHLLDAYEGAESLADLQARMDRFRDHIYSLPHENILIAAHGASGRALYRSIKGLPISHHNTRFNNAEIHKFL